jgi:hypothetical protein
MPSGLKLVMSRYHAYSEQAFVLADLRINSWLDGLGCPTDAQRAALGRMVRFSGEASRLRLGTH